MRVYAHVNSHDRIYNGKINYKLIVYKFTIDFFCFNQEFINLLQKNNNVLQQIVTILTSL